MDEKLQKHIDFLLKRHPVLSECKNSIIGAYDILEKCFMSGNKLLLVGNGGSCADTEHIVGELMKGFMLQRKCSERFAEKLKTIDGERGAELAMKLQGGLPAISLSEHQGLNTAYSNDVPDGGVLSFAQQVYGYGKKGDVLLCISTSGNAKNVLYATVVARAMDIKIIGLTGQKGGELATISDVAIKAPSCETFIVQEFHLPIYHCLCMMLEDKFFSFNNS